MSDLHVGENKGLKLNKGVVERVKYVNKRTSEVF